LNKSTVFAVAIALAISIAQLGFLVNVTNEYQKAPPPEAIRIPTISGSGLDAMNETQGYQTPEPGFSAHWWRGTVCPWAMGTTDYLCTTIRTPNGQPGSQEFYYVLISCFDDAGSYNQIGFSACYGHWGLTWSWTTPNWDGSMQYHYEASATTLSQDTSYMFEMYLDNGYLTYNLVVGGWTDWTKTVYTGGSEFQLTDTWHVGVIPWTGWYSCLTLYEEIYETDAQTPDFNFKFQSTQTAGGYWDSWNQFSSENPPSGIGVTISTSYHYVWITNPDAS